MVYKGFVRDESKHRDQNRCCESPFGTVPDLSREPVDDDGDGRVHEAMYNQECPREITSSGKAEERSGYSEYVAW